MEDMKVGCVCVILAEQMNIKTVGDQGRKKKRIKFIWLKPWLANQRQTSAFRNIFAQPN